MVCIASIRFDVFLLYTEYWFTGLLLLICLLSKKGKRVLGTRYSALSTEFQCVCVCNNIRNPCLVEISTSTSFLDDDDDDYDDDDDDDDSDDDDG